MMKKYLLAGAVVWLSVLPATAQYGPKVNVDVPQEIFTQSRQKPTPCQRCCIYNNASYSEGAIINVEDNTLQCQREKGTIGTNPLIWQRIKP